MKRSTLFLAATGFGVSSTLQAYWLDQGAQHPVGSSYVLGLLLLNLIYWYVPAALAPFIMALSLRYHPDRMPVRLVVLVHVAGVLVYSSVHTAIMLLARSLLSGLVPARTASQSWWTYAQHHYLMQLDWLLMTYLFLVGLAYALAYRHESEDRALNAARLETRVVEAQLRALQHELHPHFLFNTLNTISGLMRTNIDAADVMIDQLADLLRMTLSTSGTQPVPLQHELAMLQKYLQIEQTRFGDRLTIVMDIESEALSALVPSFLLQPLVENAVRHGIAPHGRPGWVAIRVAHTGGQLTIQIRDNGDGAPPERLIGLNRGVGLANTRARLEHLYPAIHRFELSNVSDGFCVTVSIPYQAEPAADVCTGGVTKIRTLVIDDEPVARTRVVSLLAKEPDIDLVGERADGRRAVTAILELAPDLVFLDVQIPDMDGFEVARTVGPEHMPAVVFVTAYDEYALQAFEVHAIDYLLKPFSVERFTRALTHAREHIVRRRATMLNEQLLALLPDIHKPPARRERILVKSNGRIYFVRTLDIDWCEAAGNYVRLHVGSEVHLVRETMGRLEADLDPSQFVRIHRSAIVKIDQIHELRPSFNGEFVVLLRGGTRLTLSRGCRDALHARVGKPL